MDKLHMALTELCFGINYCTVITVWDHGFVPREFFTQHLELRFNKLVATCNRSACHIMLLCVIINSVTVSQLFSVKIKPLN
jgi:Membrane-associated apoptosis protein